MIRVDIAFDSTEQPWSHEWKRALAEGVARCGDVAKMRPAVECLRSPAADVSVTWGLRGSRSRIMQLSIDRGARHLVMERGFIGDRVKYAALGFDGIAGRASFAPNADPSRLSTLFPGIIREWGPARDVAIVMGQVKGDATTRHVNLEAWYQTAVTELRKRDWGTILFRPHPIEHRKSRYTLPRGAVLMEECSVQDALARAGLVVTFNSTSAVDAILYGISAHSADHGSPAWDVTSHDYAIARPDRQAWAESTAWKQWSVDELRSGEAWDALRRVARR